MLRGSANQDNTGIMTRHTQRIRFLRLEVMIGHMQQMQWMQWVSEHIEIQAKAVIRKEDGL